jgi:hypothetical protein
MYTPLSVDLSFGKRLKHIDICSTKPSQIGLAANWSEMKIKLTMASILKCRKMLYYKLVGSFSPKTELKPDETITQCLTWHQIWVACLKLSSVFLRRWAPTSISNLSILRWSGSCISNLSKKESIYMDLVLIESKKRFLISKNKYITLRFKRSNLRLEISSK